MRLDRERLRIYGLAIAAGLVAEVGLVVAIHESNSRGLGLLFFVEAALLGFVFGAGPGMAGAIVPWLLLYPAALLADDVEQPIALGSAVLFLIIVEAFLAGMAGAMRERYGGRSVPPPGA